MVNKMAGVKDYPKQVILNCFQLWKVMKSLDLPKDVKGTPVTIRSRARSGWYGQPINFQNEKNTNTYIDMRKAYDRYFRYYMKEYEYIELLDKIS